MRVIWAIVKRDLKGYFLSPIVYAVATVFLILTGLLFYSNLIVYIQLSFSSLQNPHWMQPLNLSNDFLRPLAANFAVIFLFFIPILTMRSFSEEKRSGTLELMSTYSVSDMQMATGKFLAVLITTGFILLLTLVYPAFLYLWGSPETALVISTWGGFIGMVSVFAAVGIFASATTDNQIVAALVAFGINLLLWMAGWLSSEPFGMLHDILNHLSIINHFEPLIKGVISVTSITYFVTMTLFFLFLTGQVLESKRWRG
jgi:ABC-2 type transport system permease protein